MRRQTVVLFALFAALVMFGAVMALAQETDTPAPQSVTIAGTLQSVLGCENDWAPECTNTQLVYDEANDLWSAAFDLPAGSYEYKAALNGTWDESYGLADGANVPLVLDADATVTFYYDHKSNYVTDSVTTPALLVAVGDFQSELGCAQDNDPTCLRSWLIDPDGNGVFNFVTTAIPAGTYAVKVALSADEIVGRGGAEGEAVSFTVDADGYETTIGYSSRRGLITARAADPEAVFVQPTLAREPVVGVLTAPGSYQSEIGCPDTTGNGGDWEPPCALSTLTDEDGDGVATLVITALPAGNYEMKVAVDGTWSQNYGVDGASGGANVPFEVPVDYAQVTFTFDTLSRMITVTVDDSIIGAPAEIEPVAIVPDFSALQAYWVSRDTLFIDRARIPADAPISVELYWSPAGELVGTEAGIEGGQSFALTFRTPDDELEALRAKFPHVAGYLAYQIPEEHLVHVPDILKSQVGVLVKVVDGPIVIGTGVQLAGALDDLYATDARLGVVWNEGQPSLRVWAPTAQNVQLVLFDDATEDEGQAEILDMRYIASSGVWTVDGDASWNGKYYLYKVTVYHHANQQVNTYNVPDPYSFSTTTNSQRSQIVNLSDGELKPAGWDELVKPALNAPEDIVVYELHLRDFSVNDPSVPEEYKGTFKAFTLEDSNGMQHLIKLAQAGLTHIHILPAFDIVTINEDKSQWQNVPFEELAALPADSEEQQARLFEIRDADAFNWGYDPFLFTVPEGSYSTNPADTTRIVEFREMVQTLNENGLRLVMDVVYNHTNQSGLNGASVLDRVVPGYYHRLNRNGGVETSTCCQNTATEHYMMEKLMIDSVITWATQYKVDGFRFDLMGHHMKSNMEKLRAALDALTLERDGVDGKSIYVYGEGWNFGEVQDNARGVNATQVNLAGTGIGTFNDRLRDAVRGGSPFGDREFQGFITGLGLEPNGLTGGMPEEQLARLTAFADLIRVGIAGNLMNYTFAGLDAEPMRGDEVVYNGQPAAYTLDPQENIVYISKHDNETVWDIILYKQLDLPLSEMIRMHNLGQSIVLLSQGIPFVQAGDDLLRSKSFDRDSYNSGDWFNRLDFTYQDNGYASGLPVNDKNQERWETMGPLLANPALKPTTDDIQFTAEYFREMLRIRKSSPLFRLQTEQDVIERLTMLNLGAEQKAGVIMFALDDSGGVQLDENYDKIVVIFNARNEAYTYEPFGDLAEYAFTLHPVQAESVDEIVRGASYTDGVFTVPARTAAVFVAPSK